MLTTTTAEEDGSRARRAVDFAIYVFGGENWHVQRGTLDGVETDVPQDRPFRRWDGDPHGALGLPLNARKALWIMKEDTGPVGLGRVNGRRFGFSAGLGLDAELVQQGQGKLVVAETRKKPVALRL